MFTLILGPMKSGKSLELISHVSPHEFSDKKVLYVQPEANVREQGIQSRAGISAATMRVHSLAKVPKDFDIIGIDEVHMFPVKDATHIDNWLRSGKSVIVSGLDLDYRAKMPGIIKYIHQLKPDRIVIKTATCDVCKKYDARFTQILRNKKPITSGLPSVVPEDGTYDYQARCRECFIKQ